MEERAGDDSGSRACYRHAIRYRGRRHSRSRREADRTSSGGAARAGEAQLALRFSAVSWYAVYDGSGRRLVEGFNPPDSARTVSGAPPLKVVLGNAPGVVVQLNGQKVPLEGLVHRDGTARFLLDSSGHAAPVPPVVARQ